MQVGIKILKITLRAVGLAYEPEARRNGSVL